MMESRSRPPSTVIPVLGYSDIGEAVAWLCETFDPGGHRWTFSQTIADVAPEDWGASSRRL